MKFLLDSHETNGINIQGLKALKKKYWNLLREHPFPSPPESGNAIAMIMYFKRQKLNSNIIIGPYAGISVFEAANRIASDLVIINGILQLIKQGREPGNSEITVRLGNKHEKNKGDFTINGKEGEAFNVAASFYKIKLRNTTKKWLLLNLHYILVNAEVFDEIKERELNNKIIKVIGWEKP